MTDKKTLYLIDGTAYIYRAYHAVRGLTNSKGLPTNATFGFTRMLMKLMEDRDPAYLMISFDAKGATFRHDLYPQYKANRPPMPPDMVAQLPYIKAITDGFNLTALEIPGYEADDVIGTLARLAEKEGFAVVMVTGDKDFMQLVTANSHVWDPMKDKTIDAHEVQNTLGIEPHQVIDMMGLAGDTADNVPGVPGVGPKTAQALIKTYGSMEALYDRIDTVTRKKLHENLVQYKDQAFLSKTLVTINTDVPIAFEPQKLVRRPPDEEKLAKLYKELEFSQLQRSVPKKTDLSHKAYTAVLKARDLERLAQRLASAKRFAVDTETTSVNPMQAELVGISVALKANEAFYIPCAHDYRTVPTQLDWNIIRDQLKPILEDPLIAKVGQNIKYDWMVLKRHGIDLAGVENDTMLASYLLNPAKRAHSLDQIALDYLDHKTISYEEVAGKGAKAVSFSKVPLEKAVPYACEDADLTLMAFHVLNPRLKELGLETLLADVEIPLVPVLMRMEMRGVCVDQQRLKTLSRQFQHQLQDLETRIYDLAGERFNIRSSQQLGRILFEKLQLPIQKKTRKKTAYSTDVDVLTTLASHHELPDLVLQHRTLAKLKSTYADALFDLVHPQTGRIHTSYNQTVTATGRLSSSDPNLQNIPIRTPAGRDIRRAFIPPEGWHLLSADYSQIELRILAHCSEDDILIKAFQDDEDIHARTAAEVFQVFPSFINEDLRRQAKAINFGIMYGMSPFGLSKQLNISQKMAKTYIDNYFNRYRGVKRYLENVVDVSRQSGHTSTLLGRRRPLPEINSRNHTVRRFAERTAINTPIQGTAADLLKVAMIRVDGALRDKGLESKMILTVHDELVFEVPAEEADQTAALVKEAMEGVWELKVPLKVNLATGQNWAEAH